MKEPLDKFGEFFVKNLRDRMLYDLGMLLRAGWKAPADQDLQQRLAHFDDSEKETVRDAAEHIIISGMHDLLFALQEEADSNGSIHVLVDGVEIAKESDGMHGEIFTERGWIARHSKYPYKERA